MDPLEHAIYATLAYADIFEYPLTVPEIHRYLIGLCSTPEEIGGELEKSDFLRENTACSGPYYALRGREASFSMRERRAEISAHLWPKARRYGAWMAAMPFIRMVAITGSLAVDNASSRADMDFLIVTRSGRLWTARALVILLVRLAARRGDGLCPNYFIAEDQLAFTDRRLYTAHEIVQMAPVAGWRVYERLLEMNAWTREYLPNAGPRTTGGILAPWGLQAARRPVEAMLRLPLANRLEEWEMQRKVKRFTGLAMRHPEACFRADLCKGHIDDHGFYIQAAFNDRMVALEEVTQ